MSFTLADFQAAAERKYGGLVIDDAPGGPLKLQNAMAVTDDAQRAALKDAIERINASQTSDQPEDGQQAEGSVDDLDKLPALRAALVDLFAALADRPADLRAYVDPLPLTVLVAIKDEWEAASDPKAS